MFPKTISTHPSCSSKETNSLGVLTQQLPSPQFYWNKLQRVTFLKWFRKLAFNLGCYKASLQPDRYRPNETKECFRGSQDRSGCAGMLLQSQTSPGCWTYIHSVLRALGKPAEVVLLRLKFHIYLTCSTSHCSQRENVSSFIKWTVASCQSPFVQSQSCFYQ